MIEQIKAMIYRLFGKRIVSTDGELSRARQESYDYMRIADTNITSIFANSLASLAFGDSSCTVSGDNARAKQLDKILQKHWGKTKNYIAVGNGTGMIVSVPYSVSGALGRRIYIDTVTRDRVFVTGVQGDDISSLTILADKRVIGNRTYYRWTDYSIENGVYTITQWATKDNARCDLAEVPDWAHIEPQVRINCADRLPIGIYRCPVSNRRPQNITGAPITFGCGQTIRRIADTLRQIDEEYDNKKTLIFADKTMFDKNKKISANVFQVVNSSGSGLGGKPLFEIFSPEFRDTSLYNKLDHLFALCEKEIGTSRGILTDLNTSGATATEIRRATYSTFALCDDIHSAAEAYINDLMYGVNVLLNFYGLSPMGDYKINFDWSYAMLEDSSASFSQLVTLKQNGAASTAELRRFYFDAESDAEAQEAVQKIKEEEPTLSSLIGE